MIKIQNVSKKFLLPHEKRNTLRDHFLGLFRNREYEEFFALRDISLDIHPGEWVGIIGRNGSGKSTLLRILSGIFLPDEGSFSIHGKRVPLLELGVGFHGELTVRENIFLNGTLLGISQKELKTKEKSILEFAELENFQDAKLKNLSSGMAVRLAFSIAIQADGEVFLLDEVMAVGDLDFQKKCEDIFLALRKQKKTVIFVSHNLSQINQFCDKVIWLEQGRIVAEGTPSQITLQYEKK